jgi:[acyl-carrier-protein] S-malonyltransferase
MKKAYVFPGQGAQFPGMGKEIYESGEKARELFVQADQILGFELSKIMFEGSVDDLKQTKVTQPAIFVDSVVKALISSDFKPEMTAGHSLGEFSALVSAGGLSLEDGLRLVSKRAMAMQKACDKEASTMAAIIGLDDRVVEDICSSIDEIVVPANYNCPGQLVISGSIKGIEIACAKMVEAGARRALPLPVGGAFHSPLMEPAKEELEAAIHGTNFSEPICPIYQNMDAKPSLDPEEIKSKLISQLTSPVRWTQTVQNMVADGAGFFVESGPGKVLQGLVIKIHREAEVSSIV